MVSRNAAAADSSHIWAAVIGGICGLAVILALHYLLPREPAGYKLAADILIDRDGVIYPFSVQNFMWIVFGIGVGQVIIRMRVGNLELAQLGERYLPEDQATILRSEDLVPIYRRLNTSRGIRNCFLPRIIERTILQFQVSHSVEQASMLMHSSIEMYLHEVDVRYNLLRYITWLIPSLGFIGTVVGIGAALRYAGSPEAAGQANLLSEVTSRLGISFNGTLMALILAACLAFLTNIAQSREERALNHAAQYCLDNLLNRLYAR